MSEREELAEVHAPVLGVFAGKAGIVGCSCMDARQWRSYLNARGDRSTPAWRAHFAEQLAAHDDRIRAEAWEVGHDMSCPQGPICSAHQPPAAALRAAAGTPHARRNRGGGQVSENRLSGEERALIRRKVASSAVIGAEDVIVEGIVAVHTADLQETLDSCREQRTDLLELLAVERERRPAPAPDDAEGRA